MEIKMNINSQHKASSYGSKNVYK